MSNVFKTVRALTTALAKPASSSRKSPFTTSPARAKPLAAAAVAKRAKPVALPPPAPPPKLSYPQKHSAPLGVSGANVTTHAVSVHDKRTSLAEARKPGSVHKRNTVAESLPATTTHFSLMVDHRSKNGTMQTVALFPSPNIVETNQSHSDARPAATSQGPGYMMAVMKDSRPVHHEGVQSPQSLSAMPHFKSAPVTDPSLMQHAGALRAKPKATPAPASAPTAAFPTIGTDPL